MTEVIDKFPAAPLGAGDPRSAKQTFTGMCIQTALSFFPSLDISLAPVSHVSMRASSFFQG